MKNRDLAGYSDNWARQKSPIDSTDLENLEIPKNKKNAILGNERPDLDQKESPLPD